MLDKTQAYLLYKYQNAVPNESDPRAYSIHYSNATLTWISNIFDLCDICVIELKYPDTIEKSSKMLSRFLKRTHINMWEYYGTFVSRNIRANNQSVFYVSRSENNLL